MSDSVELGMLIVGGIVLAMVAFGMVAAIFAAPGYVVLLFSGHESIGFWNSAAAGFGSVVLGGVLAMIIQAFRGN